MSAVPSFGERSVVGRILRIDLIKLDVPPGERTWFARWRVHQTAVETWIAPDAARACLMVWLLGGASPAVRLLAAAVVIGLLATEWRAVSHWAKPNGDWLRRQTFARCLIVGRGLTWAAATACMIHFASASLPVLLFFATGCLLFDCLCAIAFPLCGLVAASAILAVISSAVLQSPNAGLGLVAALALLVLFGVHRGLCHLHYLLATRRLRTRRLMVANETIQALLSQYDEHGTDWLVEADSHGRLRNPSMRLADALGRTRGELEGLDIVSVFEPGPQRRLLVARARRHQRFRNLVLPLDVHGEQRWWSLSGCALFDGDGAHIGFRGFAQDVTERRGAEERVREMATRDPLTRLANRGVFTARLASVLAACGPEHHCAVLFIDLDSFKLVNDTHGHGAGDAVLDAAARRIESLIGPGCLAARLGGDEFAVLVEHVSDEAELMLLGNALVAELSQPLSRDGVALTCGASVGIAMGPQHGAAGEALLRAADIALYEAKSRGRGVSVMFHPKLLNELQDRRALENDLREALARGEFEICYQPLVRVETRETAGYEALLRWNHPTRGTVSPAVFIPLAEEAGLIVPIGEWVLREALAEAATWQEHLTIAVNVSPAQMRGEALLGQVVSALASSGVAPHRLELEITESLLMRECDVHLRMLHRLRAFGVRIALDDFGTGFSSLNYLRRFPFDKLKIDRSFVSDIVDDEDSRAIVETVLTLAREFRMDTIAEGIETEGQLATLLAMGCSQAQGFLFDKAIPASRIPASQRKATPGCLPQVSMGEWLRGRGFGAVPMDAGYCRVNCRKC